MRYAKHTIYIATLSRVVYRFCVVSIYIVFVRKLCFLRKKYMHCTDSVYLERGITVFCVCCSLVFHESLTMNGGMYMYGMYMYVFFLIGVVQIRIHKKNDVCANVFNCSMYLLFSCYIHKCKFSEKLALMCATCNYVLIVAC